jgi:hypothetical protein
MSDSQQTKKPRTAAQQAAFKRCLEARQANMQKKLAQPAPDTQHEPNDDSTSLNNSQVVAVQQQDSSPQQSQQSSTPIQTAPVTQTEDDDCDDEYIEFDPEQVYSVMNSYRGEIDELRQHIKELKGGHDAFQDHIQQQQQTHSNKWGLHFV